MAKSNKSASTKSNTRREFAGSVAGAGASNPGLSNASSSGGNGGTATAVVTPTAAAKPAPQRPRPTQEQIAKRAYEIWIAKGRPVGRDLENWKQAERELSGT